MQTTTFPTACSNNGPQNPPRPLRQKTRPLLQHRRRACPVYGPYTAQAAHFQSHDITIQSKKLTSIFIREQNIAHLAAPRSPRNLQPDPATPAARRHPRAPLERRQAGHRAGAVLGGCWGATQRYGMEAAGNGMWHFSLGCVVSRSVCEREEAEGEGGVWDSKWRLLTV